MELRRETLIDRCYGSRMNDDRALERCVRALLNTIVDPCSRAAGCVAGLDDMGLVRAVEISREANGLSIRVVIGVTEYGCLMGAPFAVEANKRLGELRSEGVSIVVDLDDKFDWERDDMSAEYRSRLAEHRRQVVTFLGSSRQ